ncbi:MAG: hypothetical protein FWD76_03075, partial [Firmicutes bacterium]|nr:hypothetical protein [Bacillota bacterium]
YDDLGNPTTYRGKSMVWDGRSLLAYQRSHFAYNASGLRCTKAVLEQAMDITYDWVGDRLVGENRKTAETTQEIRYFYDASGIVMMTVDGKIYRYRKNILGDITAIYDYDASQIVATYQYDAWGNCTTTNLTDDNIGDLNPIRYRGYYFDTDTNLYYLKSRYYDPQVGRFVNADDIAALDVTKSQINGLNLYAYCANDPVNTKDSNGNMPDWLKWTLGIVIIAAAIGLSIATGMLASPIAGLVGSGLFASVVGGVAAGAISGAVLGFGVSVGTQGISNGFENIDWNKVGFDTAVGALSGAVTGGIFGGLKEIWTGGQIVKASSGNWLSKFVSNQSAKLGVDIGESLFNKVAMLGVYHIGKFGVNKIAQLILLIFKGDIQNHKPNTPNVGGFGWVF